MMSGNDKNKDVVLSMLNSFRGYLRSCRMYNPQDFGSMLAYESWCYKNNRKIYNLILCLIILRFRIVNN